MAEDETIERGDLFRVSFQGRGHQVTGPHYAVVVSDSPYNSLPTVVVVPFSTGARPTGFRPETTVLGTRTRALVDQVGAVDARHLLERLGNLSGTTVMDLIDEQLRYLLALDV